MNITLTLIGQVIVFSILIYFIKGVLWEPMMKVLDERKTRIADGLAAAEKGLEQEHASRLKAESELAEAKNQASEIIAKAQKRSIALIEEAKAEAEDIAVRVRASAQSEIETEVNRAKEVLRKDFSKLALIGAERILEKEVDPKVHAKAIEDLVGQI